MRVGVVVTILMTAVSLTGCNAPEAKFVAGAESKALIKEASRAVDTAVLNHFGTPHKLIAWEKLPVEYGKADPATPGHEKDGWQLLYGRNLYMRHCLHCHGVSGDGNGPTATYLNPRPRDYRQGVFKFTSTIGTAKARRDDLQQILKNGIPGTSMPSFVLLKTEEKAAIIEYIRWLAMRGEFEIKLSRELGTDYSTKAVQDRMNNKESRSDIVAALNTFIGTKDKPGEFAQTISDVSDTLAGDWTAAEDEANLVLPKVARQLPHDDPQSIARGRALFMSEKLKCYNCHGIGAKGDGSGTVDYWPVPSSTPERKYKDRGLHDTWGNNIKPRDLTRGQFRGGRRPLDIYRRIFAGIKGTQMAGFSTALREDKDEKGNALTEEQIAARLDRQIWDIVNYVLDVPHQKQTIAPMFPSVTPVAAQAGPPAKAQ